MTALVSLVLGLGLGLGVALLVAGATGRDVLGHPAGRRGPAPTLLPSLRTVSIAATAAVALFVLTGWLVAAASAAAAAVVLPNVLGGAVRHRWEVARVEAIAAWAEQLRDTMAAANGLEHAIAASGTVAPPAIASEVRRLASRVPYEPLTSALRTFADDVDHPTCDFVVAGLVVAAEREARELSPLLGQLAACARSEAQMRSRVWAGRARTRTSVRVIAASVVLFALGLLVLDRTYLEPYDSAGGQIVLAAVIGLFAASLAAMDRMGRIAMPQRFLARRPAGERLP
jgi:tight adherence protein B